MFGRCWEDVRKDVREDIGKMQYDGKFEWKLDIDARNMHINVFKVSSDIMIRHSRLVCACALEEEG